MVSRLCRFNIKRGDEKMSSWNCFKCHERIWDKYMGYIGGTHETKVKGKTVTLCGFCGEATK